MKKDKSLKLDIQFFAGRADNYPEPNTQMQQNFSELNAKSIDYAYRFGENFSKFIEALGITRQIPVQEGFTLSIYTAPEVDLEDGDVVEDEIIQLSKVITQPTTRK